MLYKYCLQLQQRYFEHGRGFLNRVPLHWATTFWIVNWNLESLESIVVVNRFFTIGNKLVFSFTIGILVPSATKQIMTNILLGDVIGKTAHLTAVPLHYEILYFLISSERVSKPFSLKPFWTTYRDISDFSVCWSLEWNFLSSREFVIPETALVISLAHVDWIACF